MDHFNTQDIDLKETQKEVLIQLLDGKRAAGEIKSDEEYQTEYKYRLSLLEANEPMTKVRPQKEQTNPQDFNETYDEITLDIMTSFSQINKVDQSVNKHQQLNQSVINNLKLNLNKVSDEVSRYERLVDYLTSEDITLETFRDSNSFDTDSSLYTERDGTLLPPDYQARLDIDREAIKLPTILSQNTMIGPAGVRLANIKIKKQLGGGLIRIQNPENGVDKAIDTSMETFWSESILVDAPIQVPLTNEFYSIKHGAVSELLIEFDYLTQLNEISILPFTEFPLEIVAIQYYESDDVNETPKEIIAPQFKENLRSRSVSDSTSFQFQDVYAKRLRLIFNQIHYVKTDFLVNDREQKQLALWFAAKKEVDPEEVDVQGDFINKPLYKNKAEVNNLYDYFNQQLKHIGTDIDNVMGKQLDDSVTAISKYMYNYGLYNLGVRKNEYQDKGIFVSKPLSVNSNIKAVTLDVTEEHPALENTDMKFSDIEYYISHQENPGVDDWYPIVPKNKVKIDAELLTPRFESGKYQSLLRFAPEGSVKVRKNGVELHEVFGDFLAEGRNISILNYDVSATYTAEYTPAKESYSVDFIEKHTINGEIQPNRKVEEFKGSNATGSVSLRYHAFMDRGKLNTQIGGWNPSYLSNGYLPIKVKLIMQTGFHIDQPFDGNEKDTVVVNNMTNYFDAEKSQLQPFDIELQNYQYIVSGNTILFNTPIPETTRIIVEYPYLVGEIRMKAILRRNIQAYYGLTPILNEYMIRYQRLL